MDTSSILYIPEGQKFDFPTITFMSHYANCGGWFVSFWLYEENKDLLMISTVPYAQCFEKDVFINGSQNDIF